MNEQESDLIAITAAYRSGNEFLATGVDEEGVPIDPVSKDMALRNAEYFRFQLNGTLAKIEVGTPEGPAEQTTAGVGTPSRPRPASDTI